MIIENRISDAKSPVPAPGQIWKDIPTGDLYIVMGNMDHMRMYSLEPGNNFQVWNDNILGMNDSHFKFITDNVKLVIG